MAAYIGVGIIVRRCGGGEPWPARMRRISDRGIS